MNVWERVLAEINGLRQSHDSIHSKLDSIMSAQKEGSQPAAPPVQSGEVSEAEPAIAGEAPDRDQA